MTVRLAAGVTAVGGGYFEQGATGEVLHIDWAGDAVIKFDGDEEQYQHLLKRDLNKLVTPEAVFWRYIGTPEASGESAAHVHSGKLPDRSLEAKLADVLCSAKGSNESATHVHSDILPDLSLE